MSPSSDADWGIKQGPESFEKASDTQGSARKVAGVSIAVVLLAGIAFGGWWLFGRDSADPVAGGGDSAPTADPNPGASGDDAHTQHETLPIVDLEGRPEGKPAVGSFADVPNHTNLTGDEISEYQRAGADDANFTSEWLPAGGKAIILVTEVTDADAAANASEELGSIQVSNGAERSEEEVDGVHTVVYGGTVEVLAEGAGSDDETMPADFQVRIDENGMPVRHYYSRGDWEIRTTYLDIGGDVEPGFPWDELPSDRAEID
jgi:hypothetical protein